MPESAEQEFASVKQMFGKTAGRQYYHIILSFSPEDDVSFELAHQLGRELTTRFPGFQCVVATHMDKQHIHDHIIMNSVNHQTGRMFHQTKQELEQVKRFVNEMCQQHGLSTTEPKARRTGWPEWKKKLRRDAAICLYDSWSREDFIWRMEKKGYGVKWEDGHKYITFTTLENQKCRSHKLLDERLFRENMETYFALGGCQSRVRQTYFEWHDPMPEQPYNTLATLLDSFINEHPHLYRREYLEVDQKTAEKHLKNGRKISHTDFINVEEDPEYRQYHGFEMSL